MAPMSGLVPGTSALPAIFSVAEVIAGVFVPSTTAVTTTGSEILDHAVGAVTELMAGPCATQTASTQASAAPQTTGHAYSQTWFWLQVDPSSGQSAVVSHFPSDGSPE